MPSGSSQGAHIISVQSSTLPDPDSSVASMSLFSLISSWLSTWSAIWSGSVDMDPEDYDGSKDSDIPSGYYDPLAFLDKI